MIKKIYLFFVSIIFNYIYNNKVFYLIDFHSWANLNDAINLKNYFRNKLIITRSDIGIKKSILHFGTLYKLVKRNRFINLDSSNKTIVFWPHLDKNLKVSYLIKDNISKIHKIHTCCTQTKKDLVKFGIKKNKIINIPLSVDLNLFKPIDEIQKKKLKKKYNIPEKKLIIGSFVKDGVGFENGLIPKKIKNPQMLIKSIKNFPFKKKIFLILSGPARGYIKKNLKKIGVEYFHKYCSEKKQLAELYNLTDVTIINSNLEGGPYSVLESLASGVPVISTKVGLAQDIIKDNKNGFLINKNDDKNLVNKLKLLLIKKNNLKKLKKKSRISVLGYSFKNIGKKIEKKIYNLI